MLGQSDVKIYQKINVTGGMHKLSESDRISILKPLEAYGFRWRWDDEMMAREKSKFLGYETPWCHANHLPGKHCGLDHQCTFEAYGIIPPRCMECWKTCVKIKNFDELVTWKKVQEQEIPFASKCGIELRDYTPKHYGAYHYAPSVDSGRYQYEFVRELVKKYLSEETYENIILKRACTEYEIIKGPSPYWHLTDQEQYILKMIETYVDYPNVIKKQADFVKPYIMMKWLLWAHMNGDFSYLKHNGGEELFSKPVTYHKGDINDIKHDLAVCQSEARGINPDATEDFLNESTKVLSKHNLSLGMMGTAMGFSRHPDSGPFDYRKFLDVEESVIGEADIVLETEENKEEE